MTAKEAHAILFEFGYHRRLVGDLRAAGLHDIDIAAVIKVLEDTRKVCLDGNAKCQCWNDE